MPIPARLLNDGEEVVAELRPHWVFLGWPLVATGAAVALAVGVSLVLPSSAPDWTNLVLLVPVVVAAVWLAGRGLRRRASELVVTTTRLVQRDGVLSRSVTEIRLDRINRISSHQSLGGRLLGTGELLVEVGGELGVVVFDRVRRPADVAHLITEQMEAARRSPAPAPTAWAGPATPTGGTPRAGSDVADQLVQLDELRRRGILTADEFEAKKAELLRRL